MPQSKNTFQYLIKTDFVTAFNFVKNYLNKQSLRIVFYLILEKIILCLCHFS